jgi:hypothetical protein
VNVFLHGANGALVCMLAFHLTKRRDTAWLAGASFTVCAVLTEAVSGVVGISDVLSASGALLALLALTLRLSWMPVCVLFATLFGLYCKESALCCVALVPMVALLTSHILHPLRPRRWAYTLLSFAAAALAFVFYVEARRRAFPAPLPAEISIDATRGTSAPHRAFAAVLRWYAQPSLPKDPLNNPLVNADSAHRLGGALRVYFRGLSQLAFPYPLSGDYSAPQEPIPDTLRSTPIVLGLFALVLPLPFAIWGFVRAVRHRMPGVFGMPRSARRKGEALLGLAALVAVVGTTLPFVMTIPKRAAWIATGSVVAATCLVLVAWRRRRNATATEEDSQLAWYSEYAYPDLIPVFAAAFLWIALSYFPVSNIPVLLPTVRAERFWYFPAIASSLLFGIAFSALLRRWPKGTFKHRVSLGGIFLFFGIQIVCARRHANDYTDDLAFWDATRRAVPRSAKAHLNYSVMKGARGDLDTRFESSKIALELAPSWPMASVYLGDTLCRMHRTSEAWPHYARGFSLAPNDVNLVALALQCLWDEKALGAESETRKALEGVKDEHTGSWVQYLANDILENGEEHNGVEAKYRPRGYNEGPKE